MRTLGRCAAVVAVVMAIAANAAHAGTGVEPIGQSIAVTSTAGRIVDPAAVSLVVALDPVDLEQTVFVSDSPGRDAATAAPTGARLAGCEPGSFESRTGGRYACQIETAGLRVGATYYWWLAYRRTGEPIGAPLDVAGPYVFALVEKQPSSAIPAKWKPYLLRPTSRGSAFAYDVREQRPYGTKRLLVHYVTAGRSAVPTADTNHNHVPDYVERVARAGERALSFYQARSYRLPPPDKGGPDSRLDIYLGWIPKGGFGVTEPELGGSSSFVVVLNALADNLLHRLTRSPERTVAHELFHSVQFAYLGFATMSAPSWVIEGMADYAELAAVPNAREVHPQLRQETWLDKLPTTTLGDSSGYGASLLWQFLAASDPDLPRAYLEAAAPTQPADWLGALDQLLRGRGDPNLHASWSAFAQHLFRTEQQYWQPFFLPRPPSLTSGSVPLTIALKPLTVPLVVLHASGPTIRITIKQLTARSPLPDAWLTIGGKDGQMIPLTPQPDGTLAAEAPLPAKAQASLLIAKDEAPPGFFMITLA